MTFGYYILGLLLNCWIPLAIGEAHDHTNNAAVLSGKVKPFPKNLPSIFAERPRVTPKVPNIIRVPFTLVGGLILIKGRVDTVEGNFFFDTGASKLLLNQRYFPEGRRRNVEARGVTGAVEVLGTRQVDTLQFDNFLGTKLSADILDLSHIERSKKTAVLGILGAKVFEDFEVLFDYERSLVVMIRTDKNGERMERLPNWEYEPCGSAPLKTSAHIALLYLPFGDTQKGVWMGIDSGAEQNLLSKDISGKFLKANFDIRRRVKLKGMGNESVEVLNGMLQNAKIDTFALKPMATILTNLTSINAAYAARMEGVLGYEFLSQYPTSINIKQRKLTVYKRVAP